MEQIKLTSKRQATFPAKLLKDLGIKTGDKIHLHQKRFKGKDVWVLVPSEPKTDWFGGLKPYLHDTKSIPPENSWRDIITQEIHRNKF